MMEVCFHDLQSQWATSRPRRGLPNIFARAERFSASPVSETAAAKMTAETAAAVRQRTGEGRYSLQSATMHRS
jgi:hypothetical protein